MVVDALVSRPGVTAREDDALLLCQFLTNLLYHQAVSRFNAISTPSFLQLYTSLLPTRTYATFRSTWTRSS